MSSLPPTSMAAAAATALLLLGSNLHGVAALDNGFTEPPMGWSALYGAPFNQVNEQIVQQAAAGLNSSGLLAAGYQYVNLDDWCVRR